MVFTITLVPLAAIFIIFWDLAIKPMIISCMFSGCCQRKDREICTKFAFLITFPIFFIVFLLISILTIPIDIFYSLMLFYEGNAIGKSLEDLFVGGMKNEYSEAILGWGFQENDTYSCCLCCGDV